MHHGVGIWVVNTWQSSVDCKVGIRRGRNGATEYARRWENAGKRKCGRSGNAEGAEMRKAECDRIMGRWMNGRGVTEEGRTERRKDGRTEEGWTDRRKDGRKKDGRTEGRTDGTYCAGVKDLASAYVLCPRLTEQLRVPFMEVVLI